MYEHLYTISTLFLSKKHIAHPSSAIQVGLPCQRGICDLSRQLLFCHTSSKHVHKYKVCSNDSCWEQLQKLKHLNVPTCLLAICMLRCKMGCSFCKTTDNLNTALWSTMERNLLGIGIFQECALKLPSQLNPANCLQTDTNKHWFPVEG